MGNYGIPRRGSNGKIDDFDPKVRVSFLSPEELASYQRGEKGGKKMFLHDDYKKLKAEGKSNKEIAKIANMSEATLYNRLKVWGEKPEGKRGPKPANEAPAPVIRSAKISNESYADMIEDLKKMARQKDGTIAELESTIEKYKLQLKESKETQEAELKCTVMKYEEQLKQVTGVQPETPKYDPKEVEEKIDQMESACADVEQELAELKEKHAALKKDLHEKEEGLKIANYNLIKKQDELILIERELSYAKENALHAKSIIPHYQALLQAEWNAQRR